MLMRLAACLLGDRALASLVRRCEVCAKMAGTGCALMLEIARNGREDWCWTISFVSDATAAGGCMFLVVQMERDSMRSSNGNGSGDDFLLFLFYLSIIPREQL
jgi:hypothetical protein